MMLFATSGSCVPKQGDYVGFGSECLAALAVIVFFVRRTTPITQRFCRAYAHRCSILKNSFEMIGPQICIKANQLKLGIVREVIVFVLNGAYGRTVRVGRYAVPYSTQYRIVGRYVHSTVHVPSDTLRTWKWSPTPNYQTSFWSPIGSRCELRT